MPPLWGQKWGVWGGRKLTPAQTRRRERVSPCSRLGALATRPELVFQVPNGQQKNAKFTSIFPHGAARAGKARAPVLMVIEGGMVGGDVFEPTDEVEPQLKLAWIKSIQAVATLESRVSFDHVLPVAPATLDALIGDNVPSRFKASAESLLRSRGAFEEVSPRFGDWLFDRIAAREENDRAFSRLTALVAPPRQFRNGVALEHDALALALKAFGAPTAEATTLALVDAQARAMDCDWPVRSVHSERRDHRCRPRPAPGAGRVASSKVFPPRDDTE